MAGYLLKFLPAVPEKSYLKINQFIIYLPLPAITLIYIPQLELTSDALYPVLAAWWLFGLAIPFFFLLKRALGWSTKLFASLVLVCGLGNTSFIGYPILTLMFGADSIRYGILVDQSTFVILSTVGVIWAASFAHGRPDIRMIILRLLKFPPFIAFIAAFLLREEWLEPALPILTVLGKMMVPLAIFSIGMQFRFLVKAIDYKAFTLGLFFKLIFAPVTIYALLFLLAGKSGILYEVTLIECAMPPMITASIIANQYQLEGDLANALVTYGIPISFLTLFGWSLLM